MTTPIVTELPLRMERVSPDSFMGTTRDVPSHDHVMNYVECDLAAELTLPQWRHARTAASTRSRRNMYRHFVPQRRRAALAA